MAATTKVRRTILVVDDDPWVRTATATLLVGEGYETLEARNGEDALAAVARRRVDLVLLDLALPTKSGLEVLRELRASTRRDAPRVVVISAYAALMNDSDACLADGVLQKPYDYDELVQTVGRLSLAREPVPA